MRQVPLREFRTRGAKALGPDEGQGVVILSNRQGPAYFWVPVQPGDLESQGRELCKAQAKASLRAWQLRARELGLDQMSDQEIDAEIKAARAERHMTRKPAPRACGWSCLTPTSWCPPGSAPMAVKPRFSIWCWMMNSSCSPALKS